MEQNEEPEQQNQRFFLSEPRNFQGDQAEQNKKTSKAYNRVKEIQGTLGKEKLRQSIALTVHVSFCVILHHIVCHRRWLWVIYLWFHLVHAPDKATDQQNKP